MAGGTQPDRTETVTPPTILRNDVLAACCRAAGTAAIAAQTLGLVACGDDKPSVPFAMTSAPSATAAETAAGPSPAGSASAFALEKGTAPPGDGRSFPIGDAVARPRSGRVFKSGLVLDADGDGSLDLIAWTETKEGGSGELSYFHGTDGGAAETSLAKLPKELDLGRCSHEPALARVSSSLVMARITADCGDSGRETKETWLAFARVTGGAPEVRLEARAKSPLSLDARPPRAAQGGHDVELVARLDGTKLEAPLQLFDKPAGFAWDPTEPETSLVRAGATLVARATKKDPNVPRDAEQFLAFAGALCTDLGDSALTINAGPVQCGDGRFVADAVHAVGLSALAANDPQGAANALDMLARVPASAARRKELEAKLGASAKTVPAAAVQRLVTAVTKKAAPLSPLAWTDAGRLLVETDDGVVEVDASTGAETKSEAIAWPRGIAWRSGDATIEILGAERRCEPPGRVVVATAKGSTITATLPSITALLPGEARRTSCRPGPLPLAPLTVDTQGSSVAVGGEVFRIAYADAGLTATRTTAPGADGPPSLPGSARSADGKAAVLMLGDALLILREGAIERWTGPDVGGLSACVVKSTGDRVACLAARPHASTDKAAVVIVAPK